MERKHSHFVFVKFGTVNIKKFKTGALLEVDGQQCKTEEQAMKAALTGKFEFVPQGRLRKKIKQLVNY